MDSNLSTGSIERCVSHALAPFGSDLSILLSPTWPLLSRLRITMSLHVFCNNMRVSNLSVVRVYITASIVEDFSKRIVRALELHQTLDECLEKTMSESSITVVHLSAVAEVRLR